jgi:hypothetical protein
MKISKLVIAVSFHFKEERIPFLNKIIENISLMDVNYEIFIFTNSHGMENIEKLKEVFFNLKINNYKILSPTYLGHPFLLTWSHLSVFREVFESDIHASHFLYLEDDICITKENIRYWLKSREDLREVNLVPSFLRFEISKLSPHKFVTDITRVNSIRKLPKYWVNKDYIFLNFPEPYQGLYMMDRELMDEFLESKAVIPEYSKWGIREKAAAGLTFVNVPKGFKSRNCVAYSVKDKSIISDSLVHHISNSYVNDPNTKHGKLKLEKVVKFNFIDQFFLYFFKNVRMFI